MDLETGDLLSSISNLGHRFCKLPFNEWYVSCFYRLHSFRNIDKKEAFVNEFLR